MDPTESPELPELKPPASKFANKRNNAQKLLDRKEIAELMLRGETVRSIAEIISSRRDYSLSFQQVATDRRKILDQWQEEQNESITRERSLMLKKFQRIESELWEAWDRSKQDQTRRSAGKVSGKAGSEASDGAGDSEEIRETSGVVKVNRDGNASYLDRIIEIADRRARLLGLYAPTTTKTELSGPGGAPIPISSEGSLTDDEQDALLGRHLDRLLEKRKLKEAPDGSASTSAETPASA